jgi:hypothetical protein
VFRPVALLVALAAALLIVPSAVAVRVHVRVEGKTRTIFGAVDPIVDVTSPSANAQPENALDALETASTLGEFFYHVTQTGFGPYIDQVGRFPAAGQTGWVFKVNGASPPVGADQVKLNAGDSILWYWAQFGVAGGPKTLALRRSGRCYTAQTQDDAGKTTPANGATLRVGSRRGVAMPRGRACIGAHRGLLVRATLDGAVRSNALP